MPALRITFALLLLTPAVAVDRRSAPEDLVAHEWGTFTSVAGEDGRPVQWAPLSGPADLPCFVDRLSPYSPKSRLSGLVRMETPVIYFYSQRPVTLSVRVQFPQGWITEWFPRASKVAPGSWSAPAVPASYRNGQIEWQSVDVLPGENPKFPSSKGASHYYAARDTDSAPLRIDKQWEKLIFYRGIGDFEVPVRPAFTGAGKLKIRNTGSETIPLAILFENRQGKLGYRVTRGIKDEVEMEPPELVGTLDHLRQELVNDLVEFGLFRREALAMVETWRDSWFEEGMRLFYLVPRSQVDSVLPLTIAPMPASTARVFVGRVEILSSPVRETIQTGLTGGDIQPLMKLGRFLSPFVAQIQRTHGNVYFPYLQHANNELLQRQFSTPACVE